MTFWGRLNWAWIKLFEACVIVSAICLFGLTGVAVGWYRDDGPVFIVNLDPEPNYIETPRIHGGDEVIIHRSMKRTDDCGAHSSA